MQHKSLVRWIKFREIIHNVIQKEKEMGKWEVKSHGVENENFRRKEERGQQEMEC